MLEIINDLPKYRLAIFLESKERLPFDFREHVQGWIYRQCLGDTGTGEKMHKSPYPCYTFALIPQDPEATKQGVRSLSGFWILHIGSAYMQVLDEIEEWVKNKKKVNWAETNFDIKGVFYQPLQTQVQYVARPILIISKEEKKFMTPESEDFATAVVQGLKNRYFHRTGEKAKDLAFRFVGKPRKKLVQYKRRNLLAFEGDVRLRGDKTMIQFAQMVGLGQKPGAGLGMLI